MIEKTKLEPADKPHLHPRNLHRFHYDFKALTNACPELAAFILVNSHQNESVDFANPAAVKMLNKAILKHFYDVPHWDIPAGYLCPPIPGRADYIHYLADLLRVSDDSAIPLGKNIVGLDIGVGANCVYPIIGHQSYGWSFVGADIDPKALQCAQEIVAANATLTPFVALRLQSNPSRLFKGIVQTAEKFDFTMCNPPFHASLAEASAGTQRKWQNLGRKNGLENNTLNFGGQPLELSCEGGEEAFLNRMIEQSAEIASQCLWFTSLVSKKTTLPRIYKSLKKVKALEVETIEMEQGQKASRIVAWTFLSNYEQKKWKQMRFD